MSSPILSDSFKKFRGRWQKTPAHRAVRNPSIATAILAASRPILAFSSSQIPCSPTGSPPESTIYRDTSDAAQAFLPPVQAVADVIPGVGGIIKGAIGGILTTLQLVDRHIQNKEDLEKLTLRLHLLRHHIDNAPVARTPVEDTLRLRLLSALQTANSQLESMGKRICGAPSLTQDIAGCITAINNHLLEYMVLSQMQLQSDVSEIKTSIVECHSRQMRLIEQSVATGATGQLPTGISRGHAILVDATGREHSMFLDQCRYFDQLDLMLRVSLYQCRPDEAEIQMWYIERKQYDFVIYSGTKVIQLTRESDIWSKMEPATRIVMRVITEEVAPIIVTATYKCPCGTPNTINACIEDLEAALQRGCTITCRHCERRFQITRTERNRTMLDSANSQEEADTAPKAEAKHLIRNFLAKQVVQRRQDRPIPQRSKSSLSSHRGPAAINSKAMLEANARRRRHPAQFECPDCKQNFTALFSLKRHMLSHTGERPLHAASPAAPNDSTTAVIANVMKGARSVMRAS